MDRRSHWGGRHSSSAYDDVLQLSKIRLDRQGYSPAGRYFGTGAPVWEVFGEASEGADIGGEVFFYIRASDAHDAMREVRSMYPHAMIMTKLGHGTKNRRHKKAGY